MKLKLFLAVLCTSFIPLAPLAYGKVGGHFEGEVVAKFLPDGRNIQLM